jgi:hypothetical protein
MGVTYVSLLCLHSRTEIIIIVFQLNDVILWIYMNQNVSINCYDYLKLKKKIMIYTTATDILLHVPVFCE